MKLTILLINIFLLSIIISCRSKTDLVSETVLKRGQAYYYFEIKKMYDGSKDFDLLPYISGLAGEKKSLTKRRDIISDKLNIIYVVNIPESKTSHELRIGSEKTIARIKLIADFHLDIQTWNGS